MGHITKISHDSKKQTELQMEHVESQIKRLEQRLEMLAKAKEAIQEEPTKRDASEERAEKINFILERLNSKGHIDAQEIKKGLGVDSPHAVLHEARIYAEAKYGKKITLVGREKGWAWEENKAKPKAQPQKIEVVTSRQATRAKRQKRLTDHEIRVALDAYNSGKKIEKIAETLDVTYQAILYHIKKATAPVETK